MTDRREAINLFIKSKGEVRFNELEELFPDISGMTIRRDLEHLEQKGEIVRTRGGAKSIAHLSMLKEAAYTQRMSENVHAKVLIAKKAMDYINQGRSLFVDSGSTGMFFAQSLPDDNYFVLTASPYVALELIKLPSVKVNLIGGQLDRDTMSISGHNSTAFVEDINIDVAFMAASAFSTVGGFTCGDFFEAEIKRAIINKAHKTVMMMDHSKLDHNMPYTFAAIKDIDILVTDQPLEKKLEEKMLSSGVQIV